MTSLLSKPPCLLNRSTQYRVSLHWHGVALLSFAPRRFVIRMQALNIPTKINKGTVEIVSDVKLIAAGDKVGASEATLLAKLGIKPFSYGLIIRQVLICSPLFHLRGCPSTHAAHGINAQLQPVEAPQACLTIQSCLLLFLAYNLPSLPGASQYSRTFYACLEGKRCVPRCRVTILTLFSRTDTEVNSHESVMPVLSFCMTNAAYQPPTPHYD